MRRWKQALAATCFLLPAPAWAWGVEGHEVVAHLAAMNLTPKARAEVASLLGGEAEATMAIAANWADEIRDDRPQTAPWHYVTLQVDGDLHYDAVRDCPADNCVVGQIQRDRAVLESQAPAAQKSEALKFLIHFVGDIRQPLHAGENHDRGGNTPQVSYRGGKRMSLHRFWDDDMVASLGRDPITLARSIDTALNPAQKASLMAPATPAAWAEESAAIARTVIYPQMHGNVSAVLQDRDVMADAQVSRLQLARAGYGLAGMLNRIFK
jgi:nuclease S1